MKTNSMKTSTPNIINEAFSFVNGLSLDKIHGLGVRNSARDFDFIYGYPPIQMLPRVQESNGVFAKQISEMISLYIHIPFCSSICSFCYFKKFSLNSEDEVEKYLLYLNKEIKLLQPILANKRIHSIFIGGGTPSILTSEQISKVWYMVYNNFTIDSSTEITFEVSPGTITPEKLAILKDFGITRISIGIQSFNDKILEFMNRDHDASTAIKAVESIRRAGFHNFNVDIIFGCPGQTFDELMDNLKKVVSLDIPSITFYQLWAGVDTPIRTVPLNLFPTEKQILVTKQIIKSYMELSGYLRDKTDWFIKSQEYKYRQQDHKWSNKDFLGIGLSSYGYFNNYYYRNACDFRTYFAYLDQGKLPIKFAKQLGAEDTKRRAIILGIKKQEGLEIAAFQDRYAERPVNQKSIFANTIAKLINADILEFSNGNLRMTYVGYLFGDSVCKVFFSKDALDFVQNERLKF